MEIENQLVHMASVIGEPARAKILWNLLDGKAYTAGELASFANISPQSASNHLSKLLENELLTVEKQGRHRYYKLSRPEVAHTIESMATLISPKAAVTEINNRPSPTGVKYARTCYDHLAGKVGVMIAESLVINGIIIKRLNKYDITTKGRNWFHSLNIDVEEVKRAKRSFAHPCLDWSERKHHLAGSLGAALLKAMLNRDWIRRKINSREVILTYSGQENLDRLLKLNLK